MKVAQIVSTFLPYYGGQGNVAYHYGLELTRLGHKVTVFTPRYQRSITEARELPFSVVRLHPLFRFGNAAFLPQLYKKVDQFDIVHLHIPFFGGAEIVALKKNKIKDRMRLVITYHMDIVGQGFLKEFFTMYKQSILPVIIDSADKIIATSYDYLKQSDIREQFEKDREKFIEIPLGVDIKRFYPQEKDVRLLEQYGLELNDKIILFVGALDRAHYFKGLEYLIKALKNPALDRKNYKLVIVGQGPLRSYYEEIAKLERVKERIVIVNRVEDDQLPKFYNISDVCVLPSIDKTEAFGLVLLEAMACQKPVVATNLAGVRTLVENEVNGYLVEPKDVEDLAQKLNTILESKELTKKFGKNSREKVETKYGWKLIGKCLDELYQALRDKKQK